MKLRRTLAALLAAACAICASAHAGETLRALVLSGDHAGLAIALEGGADPNAPLPDGSVPLAWASELQDETAVRLLLDHGADTNGGANAFSPLLVACLHPDADVLDALISAGAHVDARSREDVPVLSICAGRAPTAIVERLLDAGAPVDATDAAGQTALMWAAAHSRQDTFALLLARGAAISATTGTGFTPLFFAIKSGSGAMAAQALAAGADLAHRSADGTSALQLALYQRNTAFARTIAHRFDLAEVDVNGHMPLHAAVMTGDTALVAALLDAGADANALTSPSRIHWRFESNFKAGDYTWPIVPPLFLAAKAGDADTMMTLAEGGAEAGWRDDAGVSLLHVAARSGTPAALEAALALLPDANLRDNEGRTPLHVALKSVSGPALEAMLATLAAAGARDDLADAAGETPADIAGDEHFKGRPTFAALFEATEESGP